MGTYMEFRCTSCSFLQDIYADKNEGKYTCEKCGALYKICIYPIPRKGVKKGSLRYWILKVTCFLGEKFNNYIENPKVG